MSELNQCHALILAQQKLITQLREQNDLFAKRAKYVCDNQCKKRFFEICVNCDMLLCDNCLIEECWDCDSTFCANCSIDCITRKCSSCQCGVVKCEQCDDRSIQHFPCLNVGCQGQMLIK